MVTQAFYFSTWEAEIEADGSWWVQDQFDLYGEFQASEDCIVKTDSKIK